MENKTNQAAKILLIAILALSMSFTHSAFAEAKGTQEFQKLMNAAKKGDAEAQYWLGAMYADSESPQKNLKEAVKWFRKSAEQEFEAAQYMMGIVYESGMAVKRDFKEAASWFTKAAMQGFAPTQCELALMYLQGVGVTQQYSIALTLFSRAAEQGYPEAIYCCLHSVNVPHDYVHEHDMKHFRLKIFKHFLTIRI